MVCLENHQRGKESVMTGASIEITIDDRELLQRLDRMDASLQDLRPAYKSIGEYMLRETELRFDAQKDPDGNPWEALSAATLLRKKHSKILTERARLRGSIAYKAGSESVRVGTNMVYGAAHQFGLDEDVQVAAHRRGKSVVTAHLRKAHIPARPYLGVNDENSREFVEILMEHIEGSNR